MDLFVKEMNRDLAIEALNWEYDPPYDLYNGEVTTEAMDEMLVGSYQGVVDINQNLVGFFLCWSFRTSASRQSDWSIFGGWY